MNLAAAPPAKKQATASGLRLAISVSSAWNSTCGKGRPSSLITVPPALVKLSLKPSNASSPAAYLWVIHTALRTPRSNIGLPSASVGCELVNEVRNTLGAHSGRVAACDAGVRDDAQHAALARHLLDAHLHAGVHGADDHVHLVALDQPVGVFDALGRLGFVVDLEPFDLAAAQLAAFFVDRHAKAVLDGHAQLRVGAGVGQHQADADLAGLGAGDLWQQQPGGRGAHDGGTAGEDESAGGHSVISCC